MKKRKLYLCLLISLCFILPPLNAQGNSAQRIVSLGSTLTEELYLLGAQDKIVGVTIYCQRPAQAQTKEKVGGVTEVDLEKIIALKPRLVLATSLTSPKTVEKLKQLRIKTVVFAQPKSFAELCASFLELAKLVSRQAEAEEIIHLAGKKTALIKEKVKYLSKPKVFIQIGANPLFSVAKDSFINDFIEFAGGINIASDSPSGLYSREKVIENNPDIVIIATMGTIAAEKEKKIWQKYETLNAAKNNRIYIIDAYKICSPTPATFADSLEEITKLLHHE